ncbi:MAG: hypothetical protein ACR2HG_11195 [Pyrinomonadaceae bacterium]
MDEYLFSGESVIEKKSANFLLGLDEHGLPRFGLFGLDAQMLLTGLPEKSESIGGHLFLTNFRLFFLSHRFNRFKGTFSIFLPNINEAKHVSQPLTLSKIMQIVTRNHKFEFVVWKIPKLIAAINAARDSVLPANIEELQNAVHEAPEKCGDGFKISPPVMNSL